MSGEKKVRKRIGGQDEILRQGQDERRGQRRRPNPRVTHYPISAIGGGR